MGGLSSPLHFLWGDIRTYLISSHPTPHPPSHEFPSHHSSLPNSTIIYLKLVKPGYKRGGNGGGSHNSTTTVVKTHWSIAASVGLSVMPSCWGLQGGCRGGSTHPLPTGGATAIPQCLNPGCQLGEGGSGTGGERPAAQHHRIHLQTERGR